ncbi:BAALC binder of MAP3K1 and KLF4 a [Paramisgurnus dabryanus]|uniref:BAALC binder of MAP3K1 and KLF4 a n=1 Tax=Misgurnus anguillicaudatus TaxID=75329 RepID=UPI0024353728|nr:BAALC binder of MAP3K1 and KLF4 a [Misgurnus anguillicaudatus]
MLTLVSMGCGGSRSAMIEPRYLESRDTESTWLTNTDTEVTQLATGTGAHNPNGTGDNENTAPTGSGKREDQGSCVKERKLVNAGTQCSRSSTLASISKQRSAQRDEVKNKSKKISPADVSKSPVPL